MEMRLDNVYVCRWLLFVEKRRHFIFWLKALTTDQRDALMQISVKSGHGALPSGKLCSEMKTPEARTLFVNILRSIRNEGELMHNSVIN